MNKQFKMSKILQSLTIISAIIGGICLVIFKSQWAFLLMIISFVMIFLVDICNSAFESHILTNKGVKTYGTLINFKPAYKYTGGRGYRDLILEFNYIKQDGQSAKGEVRTQVRSPIEARLNKGMILPIMYNENMPNILAFEDELNYDILEEGKELEKKYGVN